MEGQISHYLNKVLRIEADLQLRADPYERTLERVDYRAGYRRRSVITSKGIVEWRRLQTKRIARSRPRRGTHMGLDQSPVCGRVIGG